MLCEADSVDTGAMWECPLLVKLPWVHDGPRSPSMLRRQLSDTMNNIAPSTDSFSVRLLLHLGGRAGFQRAYCCWDKLDKRKCSSRWGRDQMSRACLSSDPRVWQTWELKGMGQARVCLCGSYSGMSVGCPSTTASHQFISGCEPRWPR